MAPNLQLPPLNPANARSTIAGLLAALGFIAFLLPPDWRNAAQSIDREGVLGAIEGIVAAFNQMISGFNVILIAVGFVWTWIERRAPKRALTIAAPVARDRSWVTFVVFVLLGICAGLLLCILGRWFI